jgi:DNA polymerase-3 subunit delta
VQLKGRQVDSFLRAPDPAIRAVLVHGPDSGLVAERVAALARQTVSDLSDPFRAGDLSGADLAADPARLQDEAQARALTGGTRIVIVRNAREDAAGLFEALLALDAVEARIVVQAGELTPRSALRKLFEGAANAASMACYPDDGDALGDLVRETLAQAGLDIEPAALSALTEQLGTDRLLTRRELEKLVLYMEGASGPVTLADVQACTGDGAAHAMDDVVYAAADGDAATLDSVLQRAFVEGLAPIGVLRMMANHIQKLQLAVGHVERGGNIEGAMRAIRPPIFFKRQDAFRTQMRQWDGTRLAGALTMLTEAEIRCKTTGMPEHAVCARALFGIAAAGRPRRRR